MSNYKTTPFNRVTCILITVVLLLSTLVVYSFSPLSLLAAETDYGLLFNMADGKFYLNEDQSNTVAGNPIYTGQSDKWDWNAETSTLTLDGFEWESTAAVAVRLLGSNLTMNLNLQGVNTIKTLYSGATNPRALHFDPHLVVQGNGVLNVTSADTNSNNIAMNAAGFTTLTVDSGTLNVTAGAGSNYSTGIFAQRMTVNGGTVNASSSATTGMASYSSGINVSASLRVNGGEVIALAGTSPNRSHGVRGGVSVGNVVQVYGGTLVARGYSWALYTYAASAPAASYTWETSTNYDASTSSNGTYPGAAFVDSVSDKYVKIQATSLITSAAITITAPATAGTPDTTASGTGNFTIGAVSWSPSHNPFQGGTQYTAQVTLTANANYSFAGLAAAAATINGQTATIVANTGATITLSYEFAATVAPTLSGLEIVTQPTKLTYTYGETLDLTALSVKLLYNDGTEEIIALAGFAASGISASPANGAALAVADSAATVAVSCGGYTVNTNALTVNKAAGAAVSAPGIDAKTTSSISLNAVAPPANGQTVEYAYSTSDSAPATGWQDTLNFTGLSEYTQYYFFARAKENGNYNAGAASASTAGFTADATLPTGEIAIKTNSFTSFINTVTFGLFFNNTVDVTLTGSDSGSGVSTVEYIKVQTTYATEAEVNALPGWTPIANAGTFSIPAAWNGYIYARITDNDGNSVIIRSDGVVVYTNSTAATASVAHTKLTGDKTASVNLNGNTIAKINDGTSDLMQGTDYTLSGEVITFTAAYLDSLTPSETPYTLTVYYHPQAKTYAANGQPDINDVPATTTIALTISAALPMVTSVTINPSTVTVQKGATQQFAADVTGTNDPTQTVIWGISGNGSANTGISATGLLTVGADETATTLIITATSTVDASQGDSATVTLTNPPPVTYALTVNDGTGSGNYAYGAVVSITANAAPAGKVFDTWTSDDGIFGDANSASTTFTMPNKAAAVTATYKDEAAPSQITYPVLEHFGTWVGGGTATARVDGADTKFVLLRYKGQVVAPANYSITAGSTVITLTEIYLNTLENGVHTFIAEYSDGASEAITLTIVKASASPVPSPAITAPASPTPEVPLATQPANPATGSNGQSMLWLMCLASLLVLGITVTARKFAKKAI